jgi:hypothetical protein
MDIQFPRNVNRNPRKSRIKCKKREDCSGDTEDSIKNGKLADSGQVAGARRGPVPVKLIYF